MELEPIVKVGDQYRIYYGEDNLNNVQRLHILAIIERQVMFKYWTRRGWRYCLESSHWFKLLNEKGYLIKL